MLKQKKIIAIISFLFLISTLNSLAQNMDLIACINVKNASLLGSQINAQPQIDSCLDSIGNTTASQIGDPWKIDLTHIGINCAKQSKPVSVTDTNSCRSSSWMRIQYGIPGQGYNEPAVRVNITQGSSKSQAVIGNTSPPGMGICNVHVLCNARTLNYTNGSTVYLVDSTYSVGTVGETS